MLFSKATCNHQCTHSPTTGAVDQAGRKPALQEQLGFSVPLWDTSTLSQEDLGIEQVTSQLEVDALSLLSYCLATEVNYIEQRVANV